MKSLITLFLFFTLFVSLSCNQEEHFISDPQYRKKVKEQFDKQVEIAATRSDTLFNIFDQDLSTEEEEALEFLYAYMSLNDLADYNGEFFLKNVRSSLAARDTFSWGKTVPEEIFRHFVLPVRVNNENLDSSRWVFFAELKDRIKGMSMKEAALEVNHWCHENVIYKGSDIRTSSPLATVKTAFGRCGEESTLTTAAMRAVGIPARQCYTPRWAHCDDNHAWVEVWADGGWHYLGACEPEPELDMGWFTGPVKQAMLVNTNVFGDYNGPEDILLKDERYTRINILPNYTETKRIYAVVSSTTSKRLANTDIEFQLYNYGEFYPLLRTKTDKNGIASILTGYGDLMVWAARGKKFGFAKADVRQSDTVFVILELTETVVGSLDIDFVPPVKQEVSNQVTDSMQTANSERLKFEDHLRASYEATFIDSSKAYRLAKTLKVDPVKLWHVLKQSRGNWREIIDFVSETPDSLRQWIFPLLDAVSEKDLRDINPEVLLDAIMSTNTHQFTSSPVDLVMYTMNPRVDNEWLKPYLSYLKDKFSNSFIRDARLNPEKVSKWININIKIDKKANYSKAPITPVGVYELTMADPHSRDIFFVALCRSFGIPARLEQATKTPQYYQDSLWKKVYFEAPPEESERNSTLVLRNDPLNSVKPEYYINYTIEQNKDGFYRSMDYENSPLVKNFPSILELPPGPVLIVLGNRLADGTVMTRITFFKLIADKATHLPLTLRQSLKPPPMFGVFVMTELKNDLQKAGIDIETTNGLIMSWMKPNQEPTKHLVADLQRKAREFEEWNGSIVLLFPTREEMDLFIQREGETLPGNVQYGTHADYSFGKLFYSLDIPLTNKYPVVLYINPNGIINYFTEGYRIGIGDELLKLINR
ncbi:MAG: transglutaminase domain-containing protein [Bacteroidetes bacterium]|nr:transglutaminase domain-containing protein [Bacteroidota bacterium]